MGNSHSGHDLVNYCKEDNDELLEKALVENSSLINFVDQVHLYIYSLLLLLVANIFMLFFYHHSDTGHYFIGRVNQIVLNALEN